MCGICGIWSRRGVNKEDVRAMADAIEHRGPDDDGYYVGNRVAIANRRLSIIDLATGKQPISNEDETIHVVFNGEIYNYAELRADLIQRGHRFRTNTDTETIVHLYEEFGPKCVTKLNGMFAFALWDEVAQRLFLARDPLGQKPLYHATVDGDFIFGSEIKSLLRYPGVSAELDTAAMHDNISLRCIPGTATMFRGISKLPAGHFLTFENGNCRIESYWDLNYTPKINGSLPEIVGQLRELLESTVESHMVSDVPIGAFLSGGIDSSLIVAMMARQSDRPINTFSIGVREASFNELPYAQMLAKQYNTNHYEAIVRPDLISMLPEMIYHMEEPVDPFAFGVYSVSELAAQHVKVVLGGDGGDEIFGGYDRYAGQQLVDLYCAVPAVIRHRVIEPIIRRLPDSYQYNSRVQKLRWMTAMSKLRGGPRYAESCCYLRFTHERKQKLYTDALWRELGEADSTAHLERYFDADNAEHQIDRMLYTDVKTRLPEHLLMIGDRMTMAHSIEGRSPYVDPRVAEFVARIPAKMKVHGRHLKIIQRQASRGLIPDQLVKRKKQGFSFPLASWFKHELRDTTATLLSEGSMSAEGYFRPEAMRALLGEHVSGKVDHNYRLWLLLNLELWHRMFIEGQSKESVAEQLKEHLSSKQPVFT